MNSHCETRSIPLDAYAGAGRLRVLAVRLRRLFRRAPPAISVAGWSEHMLRDVGLADHLARRPYD